MKDSASPNLMFKTSEIDAFLGKPSSAIQRLEKMLSETKEFPGKQILIYNLMRLTNDVQTFSSELINNLSQDEVLAKLVIEKASLYARLPKSKITALQLQQSIHKLGYGLVHNVVQDNISKQIAKVYFNATDENTKILIKKSLRLAYIAKDLSQMFKFENPSLIFFAGLYLYLGQTITSLREPRAYKEITNMVAKGTDEASASLVVLGFSFGELAAKALNSWDLPEELIDIVRNQANQTLVNERNRNVAKLLKFAEHINQILTDKASTPVSTWEKAYEFCRALDYPMDINKWIGEVKLVYIKMLEAEHSLFQR